MCTSGSKWYCHLCNMDKHCHTTQLHYCGGYGISFPNKCCYSFFMHTSVGSNYMVIIIIYFLLQILSYWVKDIKHIFVVRNRVCFSKKMKFIHAII